jgi:hypothetical protein
MRLAVTAPGESPTLANLESNALIAVTLSRPTTYETIQLKGSVGAVEQPCDQDLVRAHERLDQFAAEVALLVVEEGADNLFLDDLRVVSFEVESIFDQTLGPLAGTPL